MRLINVILEKMYAGKSDFFVYIGAPWELYQIGSEIDVTSVVPIIPIPKIIELKNLWPSCGQPYHSTKFEKNEANYNSV